MDGFPNIKVHLSTFCRSHQESWPCSASSSRMLFGSDSSSDNNSMSLNTNQSPILPILDSLSKDSPGQRQLLVVVLGNLLKQGFGPENWLLHGALCSGVGSVPGRLLPLNQPPWRLWNEEPGKQGKATEGRHAKLKMQHSNVIP